MQPFQNRIWYVHTIWIHIIVYLNYAWLIPKSYVTNKRLLYARIKSCMHTYYVIAEEEAGSGRLTATVGHARPCRVRALLGPSRCSAWGFKSPVTRGLLRKHRGGDSLFEAHHLPFNSAKQKKSTFCHWDRRAPRQPQPPVSVGGAVQKEVTDRSRLGTQERGVLAKPAGD